jgi:hypothetical protein
MRHVGRVLALLAGWVCVHGGIGRAAAQTPVTIPVQGFLTDAAGTPIDGPTALGLSLYASESGSIPLFAEAQTVEIRSGFFTVQLGALVPLDAALFRDERAVYVGIRVGGEAEMTPRIALGEVPAAAYAVHAGTVDFADIRGVPPGVADGDDVGPVYRAGTGVRLASDTFSVDPDLVQSRVSGVCPPGSAIRAIGADGTVMCETDDDTDTDTNTTYSAGAGLTLSGTTFSIDPAVSQARVTGVCGSGQAITGINENGSVICAATGALYAAGEGLSLSGTTFSADLSVLQRRVSGTCAVGSFIREIRADGTVVCGAPSASTKAAAQHAWNVESGGGDGSDFTLPGSTFSVTTTGGPLLITMNVAMLARRTTSGFPPEVACEPQIDGVWAGTFGGLPGTDIYTREGRHTPQPSGSYENWDNWSRTRLYPGVPAGTHTVAIRCRLFYASSIVAYCGGSQYCSLSVVEF